MERYREWGGAGEKRDERGIEACTNSDEVGDLNVLQARTNQMREKEKLCGGNL